MGDDFGMMTLGDGVSFISRVIVYDKNLIGKTQGRKTGIKSGLTVAG